MDSLADRFSLISSLGEGAMGRVWLAEDRAAGKQVALKVISKALGANEKTVLMFRQEFRMMAGLRHPNCCEVYDFGVTVDENPFFTMEVVPGVGLDEILPLPASRVREVLGQLLRALAYVHLQGYVHRDLKSANVRVREDGTVKLMDYGLMDFAGRGGVIAGTLPYISPEMARRDAVDCRSDLYAVGILAYELLTGHVPFQGASPVETLRAHLQQPPPPMQGLVGAPDAPLEAIVMKLLAKEPIARHQSADEVLQALGFEAQAGAGANLLYAPMVGREPHAALLGERIERVAAGRSGGTVVLVGPAGIGKSRLAEEARHVAQLSGLGCASGASFATAQTPYGPFVQVLRQLLPNLQAHAPEVLATYRRSLAVLLPEIGPEREATDPEASVDDWQGLQTAIAESLLALSQRTGLVIMLDDWQWADPSSERLLAFMQRVAGERAMLFVVTTRAETGPGDVVAVEKLAGPEVGRLVAAMLGDREVDPVFAGQVAELADGNPAFVERVLEHLVRRDLLKRVDGRWQTSGGLPLAQLPHNHAALVREAMAMLTPDALLVATIGALVGREFDLDVIAYASGLANEALFAALDELRRARLLVQASPGVYAFAEDDFQEVLYEGADPLDRSFLHGVLARAFEEKLAALANRQAPLDLLLAIAEHHLRGPARARALPFALEAGLRCAALQAGQEAHRMLCIALALMDELGNQNAPAERLEALKTLALVHKGRGDVAAAVAAYEEAELLARALQDTWSLGCVQIDMAKAHDMAGRREDALALLAEGLAGPGRLHPGIAVSGRVSRARLLFFAGDATGALQEAQQALALAELPGVPDHLLADARAFLGFLLVTASAQRRPEGMAHLEAAIAFQRQAGHKWRLLDSYAYLGNAQAQQSDFPAARETFLLMRRTAFECGLATQEVIALVNLALGDVAMGRYADGAERAADAARLALACDYAFPVPMARILEAACRTWLGQHDKACACSDDASQRLASLRSPYVKIQVHAVATEIDLHLGRLPELLETAETLAPLVGESGLGEIASTLHVACAEALVRQGRANEAAELLERQATGEVAPALHARQLRVRGLMAIANEQWDRAKIVLAEALEVALRIAAGGLATELYGLLGELALAEGDRQARAHFEAMAAAAEATGSPLLQGLASFGRAAGDPYHEEAKALAARAAELLARHAETLDPAARERFYAYPERQRVREGNFLAFSLPRAKRAPSLPVRRPGFGPL